MEENLEQTKKIKRFAAWGIFLIIVGGVAAYKLPDHALSYFFNLIKDIITHLII